MVHIKVVFAVEGNKFEVFFFFLAALFSSQSAKALKEKVRDRERAEADKEKETNTKRSLKVSRYRNVQ